MWASGVSLQKLTTTGKADMESWWEGLVGSQECAISQKPGYLAVCCCVYFYFNKSLVLEFCLHISCAIEN